MRILFVLSLFCVNLAAIAQTPATQLSADSFATRVNTPAVQILDVRTANEFLTGHIRNAMLADWNKAAEFKDRVQYIDKNKPVYVYCLAGVRSAAAATWMRDNGFTQVIELEGGINAWKKTGKPLEGLPDTPQLTPAAYKASIPTTGTILVDIGAGWCPPCKVMEPIVDSLQKDPSLYFKLVTVDAGVQTELMKYLDVTTIPVFIIYKNGEPVWRKSGIISATELRAELK